MKRVGRESLAHFGVGPFLEGQASVPNQGTADLSRYRFAAAFQ
ncbi:hypothetical protein N9D38_04505 [Rubripirellula sp.]|nr:hypothetical protein [Rubripirellula sp.]